MPFQKAKQSKVAVCRSRSRRPARLRFALETLERRTLLSITLPAGSLDPTFGIGGKATLDFQGLGDGGATAMALEPDGKIIVVGYDAIASAPEENFDFLVARINPDGSLDKTFGSGGTVHTDFGGGTDDYAEAVAIQTVGGHAKIVVGGYSYSGGNQAAALARYNLDGSLDLTFGTRGRVLSTFGQSPFGGSIGYISSLALQANGSIIAAANDPNMTMGIVQYSPQGVLNPTFSPPSSSAISFQAQDVAIAPDGGIVGIGPISTPNGFLNQVAVAKLTASGTPDQHFNHGAQVLTPVEEGYPGLYPAAAIAIQPDGRILVGGSYFPDPTNVAASNFSLARYNSNGTADTTFGAGGATVTPFAAPAGLTSSAEIGGLAIQSNGDIVAAGEAVTSEFGSGVGYAAIGMARYLPNGRPDVSFGTLSDGTVILDLQNWGSSPPLFGGVVIAGSGKIIEAGTLPGSTSLLTDDMVELADFNPDGSIDAKFGIPGPDPIVYNDPGVSFVAPTDSQVDQATQLLVQPDGKSIVIDSSMYFPGDGLQSAEGGTDYAVRFDVNGRLDPTFGNGGIVNIPGDTAALQPDGKIVIAAGGYYDSFEVERLDPNGTLDSTFGPNHNGMITVPFAFDNSYPEETPSAVLVRPNGRIVIVGTQGLSGTGLNKRFFIAQLTPSGALDTTFGGGTGEATTTFASFDGFGDDSATSASLQSDGKLVVGGIVEGDILDSALLGLSSPFPRSQFGLARYNLGGTLDTSFGTGGLVTTQFITDPTQAGDGAFGVQALSNGKILAAGTAADEAFALAEYNSNGTLNTQFGPSKTGKIISLTGGTLLDTQQAHALAVQPDGDIIVTGAATVPDPTTDSGQSQPMAVVRYKPTGNLDASFGSGGIAIVGFSEGSVDDASSIAIQPNGAIVIAGSTTNQITGGDLAIAHLTSVSTVITQPIVTGFNLINADTGKTITPLTEGGTINLAILPPDIAIQANTNPVNADGVQFGLDATADFLTDRSAPYDLFGSCKNGGKLSASLILGGHTITATPTALGGLAARVDFTVVDQPVVESLEIVNAKTHKVVRAINDGDTVSLSTLPAQFDIVALTSPTSVGSVGFQLDSSANFLTEDTAPYSLAAAVGGTSELLSLLTPGSHTLTVIAFAGPDGTGDPGAELNISFTITP